MNVIDVIYFICVLIVCTVQFAIAILKQTK